MSTEAKNIYRKIIFKISIEMVEILSKNFTCMHFNFSLGVKKLFDTRKFLIFS